MSTTKLYQQDVYIKEWDTQISEVTDDGIYLDRTAFFPEGGGQSCDTGVIFTDDADFSVNVIDVQEIGSDVIHKTDTPVKFKAGDMVHCRLDWDRRFDNMQRHCGEHILSGIFYQECGGVNRGFHMGDDYMTIDISLEDEPTDPERTKPAEINDEIAAHCELLANKVVWSDAPVSVFRFDSREDAEKMPLRKKLAFDEDISIVCVGSPENAADCVACCGTHPATAGQVGLIKILKVEKYKNMFRIYFEAGQRALADCVQKHNILTSLSNRYSSSVEDLPGKIQAREDKLVSLKNELVTIKKAFIENECTKLNALIESQIGDDSCPLTVYELDTLSLDDTFNMAKHYMGKPECRGRLIMLYSKPDTSYILVSEGSPACGALVKEYANFYGGKGGGNDISARAIFSSEENASLFADLLSKHLR